MLKLRKSIVIIFEGAQDLKLIEPRFTLLITIIKKYSVMTALLYYSYSRGLSENELVEIDRRVFRNQESVYLFLTELPSNVKHKTKRVIIVITLISGIWFSNLESVESIGLPMPSTPVVRVQPSYQHHSKVSIAKVIPRKKDLITYKSPKEILFLTYLTDPRLSSNQEVLKLVKELRGGIIYLKIFIEIPLKCYISSKLYTILNELQLL